MKKIIFIVVIFFGCNKDSQKITAPENLISQEKMIDVIYEMTLISVSKGKNRSAGREIIHNDNNDISLKPNDTLLYFIQRIRDEAHRFAITAHRAKRNKSSLSSIFDEIPGIGAKRKKLLIIKFGSLENIKKASLKDLKILKGIPENIAKKVFNFFHR